MKFFYVLILVSLVTPFAVSAASLTRLEGFVTKHDGTINVSSNFYFTHENDTFIIEDYSGTQSFNIKGSDLFINLVNQKDVRIGEIGLDLSTLNDKKMTRFNLIEDIEVETYFQLKKLPKIEFYLNCGITGCSIGKRKTERTIRILSLKINNGNEFCFYQNFPSRKNGVLYTEKCKR